MGRAEVRNVIGVRKPEQDITAGAHSVDVRTLIYLLSLAFFPLLSGPEVEIVVSLIDQQDKVTVRKSTTKG